MFENTVLIWLGNRLSVHGMFLPTNIHLQWDNCGENKVLLYIYTYN